MSCPYYVFTKHPNFIINWFYIPPLHLQMGTHSRTFSVMQFLNFNLHIFTVTHWQTSCYVIYLTRYKLRLGFLYFFLITFSIVYFHSYMTKLVALSSILYVLHTPRALPSWLSNACTFLFLSLLCPQVFRWTVLPLSKITHKWSKHRRHFIYLSRESSLSLSLFVLTHGV